MKKLISLVLAIAMILAMATVTFATAPTPPNPNNITNNKEDTSGSITLGGYYEGATYKIYKMLHLESYSNTGSGSGAYTYKVETNWAKFFEEGAVGRQYVDVDAAGYVSWKTGADAVAFGKAALEYANAAATKIEPTMVSTNVENFKSTLTFPNLTLGYYLVDTSIGVVCGLDTTKPHASISVKNDPPSIEKRVEEDANANTDTSSFGRTNVANIGEIVNFDVTINVRRGAQNYEFHDTLSKGFTFDKDSLKIKHHILDTTDTHDIATTDYTLNQTKNADGTTTISITFNNNLFESKRVNATDVIYITYSATLNNEAVVGGTGNPNEAWLTYGDGHETAPSFTHTFTYGFEIIKTDASGNPLTGAEFKLYESENATEPMKLAFNKISGEYRLATALVNGDEEWCNDTIKVAKDNGIVRIVGLDTGRYFLEETKAPNGYKELSARRELVITDKNMYANYDENGVMLDYGNGVHVENNTGTTLPTTGAMGTAMFITFGMIVVIGTGVLLVTKKRMSMIQE